MSNRGTVGTPHVTRGPAPGELVSAEDMPRHTFEVVLANGQSEHPIAHQNAITNSGACLFTDFEMMDEHGRGLSPRLVLALAPGEWKRVRRHTG